MAIDRLTLPEPIEAVEPTAGARRRGRLFKHTSLVFGLGIVGLIAVIAVCAPLLATHDPYAQDLARRTVPPVWYARGTWEHILGTDNLGRDYFSRTLYGARISLLIGVSVMLISGAIGTTMGLLAGYFGGKVDTILMRITDYFLVLPDLALMVVLAAVFGPSLRNIILVIGLLRWTSTARVVRAQVRSVRERTYVKRARSLGASDWYILRRHVVPSVGTLLMANTVLTVAIAIFNETSLSFLGLGDPTAVSWGTMLHFAFSSAAISSNAWWFVVPPGIAVILVVLACSLLGQAIEDSLNPRLAVSHVAPRRFRVRSVAAE
jgi:peptide/nickel transport system permease protein